MTPALNNAVVDGVCRNPDGSYTVRVHFHRRIVLGIAQAIDVRFETDVRSIRSRPGLGIDADYRAPSIVRAFAFIGDCARFAARAAGGSPVEAEGEGDRATRMAYAEIDVAIQNALERQSAATDRTVRAGGSTGDE